MDESRPPIHFHSNNEIELHWSYDPELAEAAKDPFIRESFESLSLTFQGELTDEGFEAITDLLDPEWPSIIK